MPQKQKEQSLGRRDNDRDRERERNSGHHHSGQPSTYYRQRGSSSGLTGNLLAPNSSIPRTIYEQYQLNNDLYSVTEL